MTRRMIDSSMWLNEKFAELPAMARLLQIGIINHADDQGRTKATPIYLKARIFPYDDIDSDDIQGWLELMERNGTIILYIYDGKQHLQLANWWEYQSPSFAAPSDIPKPQGWSDRIRITTKGRIILTCNWITSDKVLLVSTCDEQGRPINTNGKPPATPVQPGVDLPPNHMVDHVNDHMVDHVTTNINEYENKEVKGEDIDPGSTARASADQAAAPPPPTNFDPEPLRQPGWKGKQNTGHRLQAKPCTHFDPRKLAGGYIPKGTGENGVEVFFEFHAFDRRSPPSKTAMEQMNEIDDLAKWRQVLEKCALAGWKPGNIGDRLDAYRNGFRHEQKAQAQAPPAQVEYSIAGML